MRRLEPADVDGKSRRLQELLKTEYARATEEGNTVAYPEKVETPWPTELLGIGDFPSPMHLDFPVELGDSEGLLGFV